MRRASSRVGRLAADPCTGHTAPALAAAAGRGASCKIVRRHRQSHMHELSNDERNLLRHYAEGERVISGLQRRSLRYSDDAAPKVYDFQLIGLQFWLGATSLHTPWPSCSRSPSHPSPRSRPCSQNVEIFCRAARFCLCIAVLQEFLHADRREGCHDGGISPRSCKLVGTAPSHPATPRKPDDNRRDGADSYSL